MSEGIVSVAKDLFLMAYELFQSPRTVPVAEDRHCSCSWRNCLRSVGSVPGSQGTVSVAEDLFL